jgi:ribonuclease BN (tRNA processing enzyme)
VSPWRVGNGKEIHSIRSEHQRNALTFCYKIVDKRSKLKPEYQGKNIPQLIKSGIKKVDMMVNYDHVEFAYLLDSCVFDVNSIKDATEIVIDCTFLNRKDREDPTHFCLEEVIDICEKANVSNVTLAHISPRYSRGDIVNAIKHLPSKYKVSHPIYGELYPNSK